MMDREKIRKITKQLQNHGIKTGFPQSAREDSQNYDETLLKLLTEHFYTTVDDEAL